MSSLRSGGSRTQFKHQCIKIDSFLGDMFRGSIGNVTRRSNQKRGDEQESNHNQN